MKKNIFSIKFYYRPEISYEDWILKVYVDDRNICEFTVDEKIEEDTGNLIFLSIQKFFPSFLLRQQK